MINRCLNINHGFLSDFHLEKCQEGLVEIVGVQIDYDLSFSESLVILPQSKIDVSQLFMAWHKTRLKLQQSLCSLDRLIISLGISQQTDHRGRYHVRERISLLRKPDLLYSLIKPSQVPEQDRIPVMSSRIIGSQLNSSPELFLCTPPVPLIL